jgi:hypothetical protein
MSVPKVVQRQVAIGKAYQNVFGRGDGRRVLVDLMAKSKLLEIGADDGPFENGRRSMVTEILATVRYDYNKLLALAEERVAESDDQE